MKEWSGGKLLEDGVEMGGLCSSQYVPDIWNTTENYVSFPVTPTLSSTYGQCGAIQSLRNIYLFLESPMEMPSVRLSKSHRSQSLVINGLGDKLTKIPTSDDGFIEGFSSKPPAMS
jgi:hypothetical protein